MKEKEDNFDYQSTISVFGFIKIKKSGRSSELNGFKDYGEYDIQLWGITIYRKRENRY